MEGGLKLVLGSSSKWRQQILREHYPEFSTLVADIDEKAIRHPDPQQMTLLIAEAKADALLSKRKIQEPSLLITSDQVIVCNGKVREKPVDAEECRAFLRAYATHPAEAICGVVVTNTKTGKRVKKVAIAKQHFKEIPEWKIEELIATGDVLYCSGGFAIEQMEGFLGELEGERETIIGMPVAVTKELLELAVAVDS